MEAVFQWMKNITCYLLFTSLLSYLMPAGKYEQYMKLFFGAVLILLVIHPLTGGLNLAGRLAQVYEQIRFTQEQGEFQQKLWGMEEERIGQIVEEYEKAVSRDIRTMAEEENMHCLFVQVRIERRKEEENFGQVAEIVLVLGEEEGEGEAGNKDRGEELQGEEGKMVSIDPVKVVIGQEGEEVWGDGEGEEKVRSGGREEEPGKAGDEGRDFQEGLQEKPQEAVKKFQRKVAGYYGLEEEAVRITWKDN